MLHNFVDNGLNRASSTTKLHILERSSHRLELHLLIYYKIIIKYKIEIYHDSISERSVCQTTSYLVNHMHFVNREIATELCELPIHKLFRGNSKLLVN